MILVTGGYGCIGAELIRHLLRTTDEAILLGSRNVSDERTARVFYDIELQDRVTCISLDVSDETQVNDTFEKFDISRIAHLGALQTPDCNAHRSLGMHINLGGTQNLIEAVKRCRPNLERFVFASSIAVYGPRASYPGPRVPMDAEPNPVNVYGIWKLASEHLCNLFAMETSVPTLSLRPAVLYGPGRDLGLTSTPTTAMKYAAIGKPYEIPFCTKQDYCFAPDVGAAFGHALMRPFVGYGAFTLPATTVAMPELVESMGNAATSLGIGESFQISHGDDEVPFICDLEYEPFTTAFPEVPHTSIADGLRKSLEVFRSDAWKRNNEA